MTTDSKNLDKLDKMISEAINSGRYDLATGALLALIIITDPQNMDEVTKQRMGEQLIELQLKMYEQFSRGTNDILTLAGFEESVMKEVILNAKAKLNEG